MSGEQWSNTAPADLRFYLWSYAGEPGARFAYWEFVDKLVSIGCPFGLAHETLVAMVEHPHYFDVEEKNGLFFIKRSDFDIGGSE